MWYHSRSRQGMVTLWLGVSNKFFSVRPVGYILYTSYSLLQASNVTVNWPVIYISGQRGGLILLRERHIATSGVACIMLTPRSKKRLNHMYVKSKLIHHWASKTYHRP